MGAVAQEARLDNLGVGEVEIFLHSFVSRLVLGMGGSPGDVSEEPVT